MSPETAFLVGVTAALLFMVAVIAMAFRWHHIAIGREDLAGELFRQYRDDPNEVNEWLCKGAIAQIKGENSHSETAEIAYLRRRVLTPNSARSNQLPEEISE